MDVREALAYFVGFRLYLGAAAARGFNPANRNRLAVIAAAAVGAALGSKLLAWFEDPAFTLAHLPERCVAALMGGKTIVGGLLGGTMAVEWIKRQLLWNPA